MTPTAGVLSLRRGTPADTPLLRAMLVEAAFWRPGAPRPEVDQALARSDLSYLLAGWGRAGDTAVIAERDAVPVGAAWYRLWTTEQHSYGFVDAATPELAIGVQPEARGQGVGTALLEALIECAHSQKFKRLSLSIERENPALRLYQRLGFRRHERADGAWTLVLQLGR